MAHLPSILLASEKTNQSNVHSFIDHIYVSCKQCSDANKVITEY
jgi:hypothetical protein